MREIFDALGGLAQKAKTSMQGQDGPLGRNGLGGLGTVIGGLLGNVAGQDASGGDAPAGGGGRADRGDFMQGKGGLLGSAALGGVLGALLTSSKARDVAAAAGKGALAVGGGAAVAAMAWGLYKKWSGAPQTDPAAPGSGQAAPASGAPRDESDERERHARLLMEAMVFAARSDGHVDEEEKANISTVLRSLHLGPEVAGQLEALMNTPVDPAALAAEVRTPEEARDIYRLSCLAVRVDQFMERNYLDALASSLRLSPDDKALLEREAVDMQRKAVPA